MWLVLWQPTHLSWMVNVVHSIGAYKNQIYIACGLLHNVDMSQYTHTCLTSVSAAVVPHNKF